MRIKSKIKAGEGEDFKITSNHNQTISRGLRIKSGVKAGEGDGDKITVNHNQTVARGLRIQSGVKAGRIATNNGQTRRSV